jgi:long-chain fatty acid transport protein
MTGFRLFCSGACGTMMIVAASAQAGGFYIPQQSVTGVGRAFIGDVAVADNASTVFANPAGMTGLSGAEVMAGGNLLVLHLDLENKGPTAASPGTGGAPLAYSGTGGGDPIDPAFVPNVFLTVPVIDQDLWFGIGLTAPFGISTSYNNDWFGRYDSVDASLSVINVGPAFAYRLTSYLSVGAGFDVQYADARLVSALPDPLNPGGPTPETDGRSKVSGDDWGYGFNVGLLIRPWPSTRFGVHYRSAMDYDIKGTAHTRLPSGLGGSGQSTEASTDLDLPDILAAGFVHELTPELALLGEFAWFGWNRFDDLRIKSDNGSPDQVLETRYQNSFSAGVAAEYGFAENWKGRAGFQYDQTPTRNKYRSTSVPDGDRYWLAFGLTYAVSDQIAFDAAYALTIFDDADIDVNRTFYSGTGADTTVNTRARAENRGDTFAFNFRYRF